MSRPWVLVISLLAACTAEPDTNTSEEVTDLGNNSTVFAVSASAAQGYSLRFQEDRLAASANGDVRLHATIVLGPKNPNGPDMTLRYDVTAADDATAAGGGLLIGLAWASGYPIDQAIQILASQNIVLAVDNLVGVREAALDVGVLVGLGDAALHAVGPGGGCEVFHAAATALQLPDGCVRDQAPAPGTGGALFALEAVGPNVMFRATQNDLTASGPVRIQTHFALGGKTPGPPQLRITSIVDGDTTTMASGGGLLLGLGVTADRGPAGVAAQLAAANIPLQIESVTIDAPQPSPITVDALANLVDFGLAAAGVGPGGGCIYAAGAGTLGFALTCATGQH